MPVDCMSDRIKNTDPVSGRSFIDNVAWYVLIAPFVIFAIGCLILLVADHVSPSARILDNIQQDVLFIAVLIEVLSLILGLIVCCVAYIRGRKLAIWLSVLGVLATLGLGALTLFAAALSNMGSNC